MTRTYTLDGLRQARARTRSEYDHACRMGGSESRRALSLVNDLKRLDAMIAEAEAGEPERDGSGHLPSDPAYDPQDVSR